MELKELEELMKSRRSIRVWQDKPVPEETLLKALELATFAPNAGNEQNWRFYVILNKDIIRSIADAVQDSAELVASWPEVGAWQDAANRMLQKSSTFRSAPALIAVTASQYSSHLENILEARGDSDPKAVEIRKWRNIADSKIQSVSAAISYLLLILHQMGLGAVWMTGPTQAKGAIEKILKIPAEADLVAVIPLGYPAENPPMKKRKLISEVTEIIK